MTAFGWYFQDFIMNEFFIANDRRGMLNDQDLSIEVHQLKMHNFDVWIQCADPIKQALQNKDHSDETLLEIMKVHLVKVAMLCALATEQDVQYLFEIAKTQGSLFCKLFKEVLNVNQAFFETEKTKAKRRNEKNDDDFSWFDSFQVLISAGHSHESIMQMSYGTFISYLKSVQKQERNKIKMLSNAVRSAHHASMKQYKEFMSSLDV